MNASQRRNIRRSHGILPGTTVCRTPVGKKTPTCAQFVKVDPDKPSAIIVLRGDHRHASWPLADVLRHHGKEHA